MYKERRGVACIINVQKNRAGTDVDRDTLTQLFKQLHFRVQVYNDADGLSANVCLLSVIAVQFSSTRSIGHVDSISLFH